MLFFSKKDIVSFWHLSRPFNILIAILTFIYSAYISNLSNLVFLSDRLFQIELFLLIWIMASGYWINDICDYKIDIINRPKSTRVGPYISPKKTLSAYIAVCIILVMISTFLPAKFFILNIGCMTALAVYSYYLKRQALIGNILIAALVSGVILAGGLLSHLKMIHLWGIIFSFFITLIREIAKDIEDMKGDLLHRLNTTPILIGIKKTKIIIITLCILLFISIYLPLFFDYFLKNRFNTSYFISITLMVSLPLIIICNKIKKANRIENFKSISKNLKWTMLGGLLSLFFLEL